MFQRNVACQPIKKLSTWQKICLATWEKPSDPSVYGLLEVDMSKSLKLLESLNSKGGPKVTVTHLIVKIFAMALAQFPDLNVLIRHHRLYRREEVDIFVQVATKENGGRDLSGAKVRNAHQKALIEIAQELSGQAEDIREGKDPNLNKSKTSLKPIAPGFLKYLLKVLGYLLYDLNISPKFLGLPPNPFGALMVTNVGVFGLKTAWAPLVPYSRTPTVITIGQINEKPIAENGTVVIRPVLDIGVTIDHRIIDGYLAGEATAYIKSLFAAPEKLVGN